MTHEELLTKIDLSFKDIPVDYGQADAHKALRAVAELHHRDPKGGCGICSWIINGFVLYEVCPTIQAIAKELQ